MRRGTTFSGNKDISFKLARSSIGHHSREKSSWSILCSAPESDDVQPSKHNTAPVPVYGVAHYPRSVTCTHGLIITVRVRLVPREDVVRRVKPVCRRKRFNQHWSVPTSGFEVRTPKNKKRSTTERCRYCHLAIVRWSTEHRHLLQLHSRRTS